jgi:hypothetical protein
MQRSNRLRTALRTPLTHQEKKPHSDAPHRDKRSGKAMGEQDAALVARVSPPAALAEP